MRRPLCLIPLFLLLVPVTTIAQSATDFFWPYSELLEKHVHVSYKDGIVTTLIDYEDWAKDPNYKRAMRFLLRSNPDEIKSRRDMIAYWINAYNLLVIDLIIKEEERISIKKLGSLVQSVWKRHYWDIADKDYTLHDIEHKILRKMEEPRIHMALVCASLSCPNLLKEPYTGQHLDEQLAAQSKAFLANKDKGMLIKDDYLTLSSIFKWFSDDFGGEEGVLEFVRLYGQYFDIKDPVIKYFPYDWTLNDFD